MSTTHDDSTFEPDACDRPLGEVEHMDDAALDAMVARAANDYNAPPLHPPTEAMWRHVVAARTPLRRGLHVQRWQLLAASVAFVAFGITIGRQWSGVAARAGAPAQRVATASHMPASTPPTAASSGVPSTNETPSSTPLRIADAGAITTPGSTRSHTVRSTDASATTATTASRSDAAYQLATMRHFVAAEALLASYDGSAHDAKADAQLASWASDLLSQTRLLIDSPAGRDPVRRGLLKDLELVLVQMAQLGPNTPKIELDLIDGSVRHSDIITRLRSAAPAGAVAAL